MKIFYYVNVKSKRPDTTRFVILEPQYMSFMHSYFSGLLSRTICVTNHTYCTPAFTFHKQPTKYSKTHYQKQLE